MLKKFGSILAVTSIATLALSACSDDEPEKKATDNGSEQTSEATAQAPADGFVLKTADTDLGTIVVDGESKTVYQFAKDTQGTDTSACVDDCVTVWPAVPGEAEATLEGVTGEVGTITGSDGKPQLTLNGWPLYYFAQDAAAGDTLGQGVKEAWWVLDATGTPIKN